MAGRSTHVEAALDRLVAAIEALPATGFQVYRVRLTDERTYTDLVDGAVMRRLGELFEAMYDDMREDVGTGAG